MQFPPYVSEVCNSDVTDDVRARVRLRFLLVRAATRINGTTSLRGLARAIDMNHATLLTAIKQGKCSAEMSLRIEERCGRSHTNNEWLRRPLEVPSE